MGTTPPLSGSDLEASASAAPRVQRIFSLCGVVPLGAFVLVHLAINASALRGGWAFTQAVRAVQRIPGLPFVEAFLILAPLLFHGALGTWLVVTRRSLPPRAPYPPAMRLGMRITAIGALAFLALHLPALRLRDPGTHLDEDALATLLDSQLSTVGHGVPWRALAYLVGSGCVTFHLACGLWGFFATSRRGASARNRRWAAAAAGALGVAMWVGFVDVVVLRATGAPLLGPGPSAPPAPDCPP